jgi:hypothetical protein
LALILLKSFGLRTNGKKHSSLRAAFHSYWNVEKAGEGMFGDSNDTSAFHSSEFFKGCTAIIMMP